MRTGRDHRVLLGFLAAGLALSQAIADALVILWWMSAWMRGG